MKLNQNLVLIVMSLCIFTQAFSMKINSEKTSFIRRNLAKIFFNLPVLAHALAYEDKSFKHDDHLDYIEKFEGPKNQIIGFVGYSTSPKLSIVVYIRGTDNLKNLAADVSYHQTDFGGYTACQGGCKVHNGFFNAYLEIKNVLFAKILSISKKLIDEQKKTPENIFFTGHSLGGALVNFATYNFINRKKNLKEQKSAESKYFDISKVNLITFGSPRVGNKAFAAYMKSLLDSKELQRHYRVIYGQDPIPNVPPKLIQEFNFIDQVILNKDAKASIEKFKADKTKVLEFEHAGTEIRFSKDTITDEIKKKDETLKAAFSEITPVRGQANVDTCLNDTKFWSLIKDLGNIADHTFYKFIDGAKLWNFIKNAENKQPAIGVAPAHHASTGQILKRGSH
jgi:hypothetical protein